MMETPVYRITDEARVRELVRSHGWATLVSHTSTGLVASHLPVLLEEGEEFIVLGHVGRPDEVSHEFGTGESMLVVAGPHGYVSPGWYGTGPTGATWNFVVAHLYGTPELLDPQESYRVLEATQAKYESAMPDPVLLENFAEFAERLARGAASFRLRVTRWQGRAKLSQNRPREVVERIVAQLDGGSDAAGDGPDGPAHPYANPELAAQMRAELARHDEWPGG